MQYVTTINDESVVGITAAREAYNASLPQTVKVEEEDVPNPALLANNVQYLDFVLQSAITSWCKQYAVVPTIPETPTAVVSGIPQSVSLKQAKQELLERGLWSSLVAYANSISDPLEKAMIESELYDSATYERNNPKLVALATQVLGLSSAQIDGLFAAAALR